MIGRIEVALRRLRRRFSRSEWLARLLRLPVSAGTETAPGLVMIQIDGLSHRELVQATDRGEMPFVRRLMEREHYRLHRQYAGVPSTTAAFQGELFYGVKGAVPAFSFMDRATGRLVRMLEPAVAARIEHELEAQGNEALLAGGSAYADNFTGGAAEPHFCPSSLGWGPALRDANPLVVGFLILTNAFSFLRIVVLLLFELVLAAVDCARGIIDGQDLLAELKVVPMRVVIAIALRELATIGVKIDVARGLAIVHANFVGYDEQAHRRGPSSRFAHWTLKGIDDAIARIWASAQQSARRHYDVWIYSDHGQQPSRPYETVHGRSFAQAVAEVFAAHEAVPIGYRSSGERGIELQRARLVGGKRLQRLFSVDQYRQEELEGPHLTVAPLGPMAMIYYDRMLTEEERASLARAIVAQAQAPLVLLKEVDGRLRAWTATGEFALPEDSAEVLGADHPFLDQVTRDLIAVSHHPDAGDFIVCGWRAGAEPITFAIENGAHGGVGPDETGAFALLPADIPLPSSDGPCPRAIDLREAARRFLRRSKVAPARAPRGAGAQRETVRIMTYNVHSCIGMDGKLSPERVARVIARYAPDVVALQELDVGRSRTEGMDQAHLIARYLEMDFHFHPVMHIEEERYGDAILTHLPMHLVKAGLLPGVPGKPSLEPRGALWVAVDVHGTPLQVMNTHLGLLPGERTLQTAALLGADWLGHPQCGDLTVLCGDLNALPSSPVCRRLRGRLNDAQFELESHRPKGTFFGRFPAGRIDHIFVAPRLDVVDVEVPNTELTRLASDHLPLVVELQMPVTLPGSASVGAHRLDAYQFPAGQ